jgi:hypothetical protein
VVVDLTDVFFLLELLRPRKLEKDLPWEGHHRYRNFSRLLWALKQDTAAEVPVLSQKRWLARFVTSFAPALAGMEDVPQGVIDKIC